MVAPKPLHVAASRGDNRSVEALLARRADPGNRATDGRTASAIAAERDFPELSKFLSSAEQLDM
jgi:ankyrin repeat protein